MRPQGASSFVWIFDLWIEELQRSSAPFVPSTRFGLQDLPLALGFHGCWSHFAVAGRVRFVGHPSLLSTPLVRACGVKYLFPEGKIVISRAWSVACACVLGAVQPLFARRWPAGTSSTVRPVSPALLPPRRSPAGTVLQFDRAYYCLRWGEAARSDSLSSFSLPHANLGFLTPRLAPTVYISAHRRSAAALA